MGKSGPQGCSLPLIDLMVKNFNLRKPLFQLPCHFQAFILGTIIHDDNLKMQRL